eukprot:357242-Chlamydomonas_euryale.AAC.3
MERPLGWVVRGEGVGQVWTERMPWDVWTDGLWWLSCRRGCGRKGVQDRCGPQGGRVGQSGAGSAVEARKMLCLSKDCMVLRCTFRFTERNVEAHMELQTGWIET